VDSLPLAERLDRAAGEGRRVPVLLEFDWTPPAKSGCTPRTRRDGEGLPAAGLEWRG